MTKVEKWGHLCLMDTFLVFYISLFDWGFTLISTLIFFNVFCLKQDKLSNILLKFAYTTQNIPNITSIFLKANQYSTISSKQHKFLVLNDLTTNKICSQIRSCTYANRYVFIWVRMFSLICYKWMGLVTDCFEYNVLFICFTKRYIIKGSLI